MVRQHEIMLTVPALPEFLRVVRVTASGLSGNLGFSIDDVDDLRLALDELCFTLIGKGTDDSRLHLRYEVSNDWLAIFGSIDPPGHTNSRSPDTAKSAEPAVDLNELSRQILTALVDEHRVWSDSEGKHFSLTKQRAVGAQK